MTMLSSLVTAMPLTALPEARRFKIIIILGVEYRARNRSKVDKYTYLVPRSLWKGQLGEAKISLK